MKSNDNSLFYVVKNNEEQFSIWPTYKSLPKGWVIVSEAQKKSECLTYIKNTWVDMRPLTLRRFLSFFLFFLSSLTALTASSFTEINVAYSDYHLEKISPFLPSKIKETSRLGGLTNQNLLLRCENEEQWVLKIFNPSPLFCRSSEEKNQNLSQILGIAPKIRLIDDTMAIIDFVKPIQSTIKVDEKTILQFAKIIAKLHSANFSFGSAYSGANDPISLFKKCKKRKYFDSNDESFIKMALDKLSKITPFLSFYPTPCHNDLHLDNFVFGKDGIQIIDWENSSMGDPAWDLAFFLITTFTAKNLWNLFFTEYISHTKNTDPSLINRVKLYQPYILISIALDAKLQNQNEDLGIQCLNQSKLFFKSEGYLSFFDPIKYNKDNVCPAQSPQ